MVSPASTSAPSPRERTRTSSSPDGASAGNVRAGFSPKEPETSGSAADMTTPSLDDCARPSCRAPPTAAESLGLTTLANGISLLVMSSDIQHISRPEGRIAYEIVGNADAPVVVLVPGMGDLRST